MEAKDVERLLEVLDKIAKSLRRSAVIQEAIAEALMDDDEDIEDEDDPEEPEDFD